MEGTIQIHVEKLPEGYYLATSDDVQGLVAQGRTITETLEIARDIVKKLLEAQSDDSAQVRKLGDQFDYPLVIGMWHGTIGWFHVSPDYQEAEKIRIRIS